LPVRTLSAFEKEEAVGKFLLARISLSPVNKRKATSPYKSFGRVTLASKKQLSEKNHFGENSILVCNFQLCTNTSQFWSFFFQCLQAT
jgi:hypothetical protein